MKHLFFFFLLALCAFCQFEDEFYEDEYTSTASSSPIREGTCSNIETCMNCHYVQYNSSVLEIDGDGCLDAQQFVGWDMEKVFIHDGIKKVYGEAFSSCKNLVSVSIPDSVTWIGPKTFIGCEKLATVEFRPAPPEETKTQKRDGQKQIDSEAFRNCIGLISITIPEEYTSIGRLAFWGCKGLETVNLLGSIGGIEEETFHYCERLSQVNFGYTVSSIGNRAFRYCTGLQSLSIAGLTTIGDQAFQYSGLVSITFEGGNILQSIGESAFEGSKLKTITIPDSVTSIGSYAFYCAGLESVEFYPSIQSIPSYTFSGCRQLTQVTIGRSITKFESHAFAVTESLKSISIPDWITDIGESGFYGSGIENIVFEGDKVETLQNYVFLACPNLVSITIPESIKVIGVGAFRQSSNLETVIFAGNKVETIKAEAFGATNLSSITIPSSVTSIGDEAFYDCGDLEVTYLGTSDPGKNSQDVFDGTTVTVCVTSEYTDSSFCGVSDKISTCSSSSSSNILSSSSSSNIPSSSSVSSSIPSSSIPSSPSVSSSSSSSSTAPSSRMSHSSISSSSSIPVKNSSSDKERESNAGMIAGIVIAAVCLVAIILIAICCCVTAGKKHGKVDREFFEEEEQDFVSMSVL